MQIQCWCNWFAEKIAIFFSEKGAGGGQRPFGNFPKIHPFWYRQASLMPNCLSRFLNQNICILFYLGSFSLVDFIQKTLSPIMSSVQIKLISKYFNHYCSLLEKFLSKKTQHLEVETITKKTSGMVFNIRYMFFLSDLC